MTAAQLELRQRLMTAVCPVHGFGRWNDKVLQDHVNLVALAVENARGELGIPEVSCGRE